jgi:hypothetical protein
MRYVDLDTLERPKDDEALLRSCKWRNLVFDKAGQSYRGSRVFSTKAEAEARIKWFEDEWLSKDTPGAPYGIGTMDGDVLKKDYHYAMPMPVLT